MARYQVILAYDGGGFRGFQRQAKARTVQGVVEEALRRIGWQGTSLLAAGRTDTGVHACGQVIAFDLDWSHTTDDLKHALNANLAEDVSVRAVSQVHPGFHPRYAAVSRSYQYHVFCDVVRHPLRERYAWRVWPEMSFQRLAQAAERLVGRHDFSAFGAPLYVGGSTERTVSQSRWHQSGCDWWYEITADAFLYHMVRRLVYIQVIIGQGLQEVSLLDEHLSKGKAKPVIGLAPACGLVLTQVSY